MRSTSVHRPFLPSTPSVIGYSGVCLTILFFSYLRIIDPAGAMVLLKEDGWIENLTAISLFLASFLLFATARIERNSVRRCVYVLGGLAMMFGAGEEISWGQRIIGFATPDILLDFNSQKEFNIHNIYSSRSDYYGPNIVGAKFLFVVAIAAFFCRKDKLLGIPLPSIFLVFSFLASTIFLSYLDYYNMSWIEYCMHFSGRPSNVLLLVLLFFTLCDRNWVVSIAVIAILALFSAHEYPSENIYNYLKYEIIEFSFAFACLLYAVELFRHLRIMDNALRFQSKENPRWWWIAFESSLPMNIRLSMINGISALIIAGSIGLAVLGYFNSEITAALVEKEYSRIKAAKPIIRSKFDVYLLDDYIIYFKAPCAPSDRRELFFLHTVPTNPLPGIRRRRFNHIPPGWFDDTPPGGRCLSFIPLPDYDIVSISTGQNGVGSWEETFRFIE